MLITDIRPAKIIASLLASHASRETFYRGFAEQTGVRIFRKIFTEIAEESEACCEDLGAELFKLGGAPVVSLVPPRINAALALAKEAVDEGGHPRILSAFLHEHTELLELYFNALADTDPSINTQHHLVFYRHYAIVSAVRDKLKNLAALIASVSN